MIRKEKLYRYTEDGLPVFTSKDGGGSATSWENNEDGLPIIPAKKKASLAVGAPTLSVGTKK